MSDSFLENLSQPQAIVIGVVALLAVPTLIVGLLEITGITTFSLITGSIVGSDLCVESATDINLDQSTTNLPSGEAWRISVNTGGCNEYIIGGGGEIPQDQIEDRDFEAESDFQAGIRGLTTYFERGVNTNPLDRNVRHPVDIYGNEVELFECDEAYRSSCVEDDWENVRQWQGGGDDVLFMSTYNPESDSSITGQASEYTATREFSSNNLPLYGNNIIVATRPEFKGDVHDWDADTTHGFDAEIVLCADGDCIYEDISHESRSDSLRIDETVGSGVQQAEVTWTGSLLGDIVGVDLDRYVPAEEQGGSMVIANQQEAVNWQSTARNQQSCLDTLDDPENADWQCNIDSEASNVFSDRSVGLESRISSIDANAEIDSRSLKISPSNHGNAFSNPQFIFDVNADWIGVAAHEPEPRILNTVDFSLEQSDNENREVQITNEGQGANINLNGQCEGSLDATSDSQWVAEGQTQTFTININAGIIDAREYTCDLEASSTAAGQGTTDTDSFTVTVIEEYNNGGNGDNGNGGTVTPPPPPPTPPVWLYLLIGAGAVAIIGGLLYLFRDQLRQLAN